MTDDFIKLDATCVYSEGDKQRCKKFDVPTYNSYGCTGYRYSGDHCMFKDKTQCQWYKKLEQNND